MVTDGLDAFVASRLDSGHDTIYGDPIDSGEVDEFGNPIFYTPEIPTNPWTLYRAVLPNEWLGLGISFSGDGVAWTSFRPFADAGETHEIDQAEWGQRTLPPPNFNETIAGNRVLIGRWWSDASRPVFTTSAWENDNQYWHCAGMDQVASTPNAFWRWFHQSDDGQSVQMAMSIDNSHRFTLFGRSNGNRIVLDTETARILINGQPLPNAQSIINAINAVKPQFVARADPRLSIGAGTANRGPQSGGPQAQTGQIVLGKYNKNSTAELEGVLIVGTGTGIAGDSGERRNGLRILDDGTVLIWPKGDLKMDFKDGPKP